MRRSSHGKHAAARYRAFVAEGVGESVEDRILGERLGEDGFLRDRLGCAFLPEVPRVQIEPLPPALEQLFAGTDPAPIATAYREHGYTLRQIAAYLGCHYSTVSRRLREQERRGLQCKT